jgi:hypothetical protein
MLKMRKFFLRDPNLFCRRGGKSTNSSAGGKILGQKKPKQKKAPVDLAVAYGRALWQNDMPNVLHV